jgi:hypothetical protein
MPFYMHCVLKKYIASDKMQSNVTNYEMKTVE